MNPKNDNDQALTPTDYFDSDPEVLDYAFNTLLSPMQVAVSRHLLDKDFTVLWANDFFYQRAGYSKEEYDATFHGKPREYFSHDPEGFSHVAATVKKAFAEGDCGFECLCRMPMKGGQSSWIRITGVFTNESVNNVPVLYVVYTSVDELVQTRLEQAVTYDSLPGFTAKFRVEGPNAGQPFTFLDGNARFVEFFGARGPDDAPYSLVNHNTDNNRAAINENYPRMREAQPVHFTVRLKNVHGEDAWFQINGNYIDRQNGDPIYLFFYIDITDLTEQRELYKRVEKNSAILRAALAAAERTSRAKSDFLSRMSHDIRTPMNAILGMVAIAKEFRHDPAKVEDCLHKVETSASFLLSLINDILDMSKIESGKMVLKKERFDFATFMRAITTMFFEQAQKKRINFKVSAGGELREAYFGDQLKLSQIMINLLGNAVKFTPEGGSVVFGVTTGKRTEASEELIFRVSDSGIGMSQDFVDKAFVAFEQDSYQRENHGGSGLGLSIAESFARMMNGGIKVKSEQGKGSTFTVRLWLESAEQQRDPVLLSQRFHHLHVLVADADDEDRAYTLNLFRKFSVSAKGAASRDEALDMLREEQRNGHPFGVLLINRKMPQMAGFELATRAQELYGPKELCVAVSSYDWNIIRDEFQGLGVSHFLPKPIFPSTLHDFLMALTQDRPLLVEANHPDNLFSGERVLLVEDNEINREVAQTLLEARQIQVDIALNGREAVEIFVAQPPGRYMAVLMDIQMPIMNGLEATRAIRALNHDDAKTMPIFAMTADAFDDDVEKALAAGMDGHISKPIDLEALFATLRRVRTQYRHAGKPA